MECNIVIIRKSLLFIALLTILATTASAQISLTADDIPGIKIVRSDTVNGKALWGLIDGGADIYFEYGFSNVTVQEILWKDHHFKVETYTMGSEEAAFGIFSVSHHRCKSDTLTKWCCVTLYQIQFAAGTYYVSVVNDSGTSAEHEYSRLISKKILEKINREGLALPSIFSDILFQPHINKIKFVSGPLGIQNGFPSWEESFASIEKYGAYILPIESDSGSITISTISFVSSENTRQFLHNINTENAKIGEFLIDKSNGTRQYINVIKPTRMLYLESDMPLSIFKLYINAIKSGM
jgi:hypothetical protein